MTIPTQTQSHREPRTFELRDAEWIEDAATRRSRAPFWLVVPVVLATLTGFVLIAFAATAALTTGGLVALRNRIVRLFGR
ncbi:MAG TPA: hypothetical protein VLD36_12185 [Burkholderiales bacterium]|jgi:hypothetical protein|nr:hypothetical protein [Burkholderiales bacterium]